MAHPRTMKSTKLPPPPEDFEAKDQSNNANLFLENRSNGSRIVNHFTWKLLLKALTRVESCRHNSFHFQLCQD